MTYAFVQGSEHKTGHHSDYNLSIASLEDYTKKGVPKDKILLGLAFYGNGFTLSDKNKHFLGAPSKGAGVVPIRNYQDICDLVKHHNWTKERENKDTYAYKDDQWIGYDDPYGAYE